jgi:hypothetical protein
MVVHVAFMVDKVALGHSPFIHVILPMLHTRILFIYHQCYVIFAIDSVIRENTSLFVLNG